MQPSDDAPLRESDWIRMTSWYSLSLRTFLPQEEQL